VFKSRCRQTSLKSLKTAAKSSLPAFPVAVSADFPDAFVDG
jgi:hypothetical protein